MYIKNKYAAQIFLSLNPQSPIIKNMGINILSKAKKKKKKSSVEKLNNKNSSKKSKLKIYSNLFIILQLEIIQIGIIKVVSSIKNKDMPSIPKIKSKLKYLK